MYRRDKKQSRRKRRLSRLVGVAGFEPTTTCTPCKCATRLRYTPNRRYARRAQKRTRMIADLLGGVSLGLAGCGGLSTD